ncbi:hypothetical protein GYMLUDRAFT_38004 [Collybiopsis luxurians FD-317 M1]|nr:hypothetical protein GYMLUDRAFT_38004 [Collybiopsis luxurians FD-317 M1]
MEWARGYVSTRVVYNQVKINYYGSIKDSTVLGHHSFSTPSAHVPSYSRSQFEQLTDVRGGAILLFSLPKDAVRKAEGCLVFRNKNESRTLLDERMSFLVISMSSPSTVTDNVDEGYYDLLLSTPLSMGDGASYHQCMHGFICRGCYSLRIAQALLDTP